MFFENSTLFLALLAFRHWEATLDSSLLARNTILPFDGIESLVLLSDAKIVVAPDSAHVDKFKYSKDPIWQKAWSERIEPNLDFYRKVFAQKQQAGFSELARDYAEYAVYFQDGYKE